MVDLTVLISSLKKWFNFQFFQFFDTKCDFNMCTDRNALWPWFYLSFPPFIGPFVTQDLLFLADFFHKVRQSNWKKRRNRILKIILMGQEDPKMPLKWGFWWYSFVWTFFTSKWKSNPSMHTLLLLEYQNAYTLPTVYKKHMCFRVSGFFKLQYLTKESRC